MLAAAAAEFHRELLELAEMAAAVMVDLAHKMVLLEQQTQEAVAAREALTRVESMDAQAVPAS